MRGAARVIRKTDAGAGNVAAGAVPLAAFERARVAVLFFAPRRACRSFLDFFASAALRHGIASARGTPFCAAVNRESDTARSEAAMSRR